LSRTKWPIFFPQICVNCQDLVTCKDDYCTIYSSQSSSLPAIYRHCVSAYLGFDIGLICYGLGLDWSIGLGLGLGLELCGLVNITV